MVSVVVFEFSGMRCQPLRRALCILSKKGVASVSWSMVIHWYDGFNLNLCFLSDGQSWARFL
ncbi:hypothetical protein GWZ68_02765 [Vibrio cholerae]|nr:hypothetical protein [Vibrio cholerae]